MKHPYLMVLQYSQDGTMLSITKLKLLSQFTEWKYSVWSSHMTLEGLFYCMFYISVVFFIKVTIIALNKMCVLNLILIKM